MGFEIKGLNELQNKLKRMQSNAATMSGTHDVPLTQILSPEFMRKHTRFDSVEALFAAWQIDVDGFKALTTEQKDALTKGTTSYHTWHDLIQAVAAEYTRQQLFK